ncbi:MAG TPA: class I SAM-dependent DNA methyltransferase [Candidatus Cloacimonadota bacterium]|nr:class I SAM-dependent DNA methyltransferase [Candidatus Cloacimonadota bacterium]
MHKAQFSQIVGFIWGIADAVLRNVYTRGKYRDVILPMTVIRRLDILLEPTKQDVLRQKKQLDDAGIANQDAALCQAAGQSFYNISPFTLRDLKARSKQQHLKADFEAYLDGFSPNVQDIIKNFGFRNQVETLSNADVLGSLIEKFLDTSINLSPLPIKDATGKEIHPALDNHTMGTVFEELIRQFNEENNEEAGQHFTPRDVVNLMADMIFLPIADKIESGTYLVYDGACGTGGMLTVAEDRLTRIAKEHGKDVSIHLYGQEVNPEIYALTKADIIIKGGGSEAENFRLGSTLSRDGFPSHTFDFMMSNPPYGADWKVDQEKMGGKKEITDPRFLVQHNGDPEYKMFTRTSDGQMMFLVNMLSKMKQNTTLGSRIAEVHNGSALFTGDAGQGESNIRRWIIENDWLEAIVQLPDNIFYNTGITTYVWFLTNRKAPYRQGKVQLIDASQWYSPLRRNLGKRNREFTEEHITRITKTFIEFKETEQSKIFPNESFGYWKCVVERPLRVKGADPETAYSKSEIKAFKDQGLVSEEGIPVIRKIHPRGTQPYPLHGLFEKTIKGQPRVVEYEPDSDLRDSEQISLLEEGGIAAFIQREVQPYAPDAWVDESKTNIGYEISFTKYFYKPTPMRTIEEIVKDIVALEKEGDGLLNEILVGLH